MRKTKAAESDDQIVNELIAIKRLLILLLVKAGASQGEVSIALEMDKSAVSRMLPARHVKKFDFVR